LFDRDYDYDYERRKRTAGCSPVKPNQTRSNQRILEIMIKSMIAMGCSGSAESVLAQLKGRFYFQDAAEVAQKGLGGMHSK
jgi:hypothetical protein